MPGDVLDLCKGHPIDLTFDWALKVSSAEVHMKARDCPGDNPGS